MENWTYEAAVEEILHAPRFKEIPSVENMKQYLSYLGHPEKEFCVIHVAGTNGKGSTCSFLESILRSCGKKTGLFTSPHLVSIRERMQINRQLVEKDLFVRCFITVKKVQKESGFPPLTFFELILVMALLIFREKKVEYAVIEAGMGGRSDATNALTPVFSIITAVGMDHMQYLGNTIEEIAREKAGIMKKNIPCLAVDHEQKITNIFLEEAEKNEVPFYRIPEESFKILKNTGKVIDFSVKNRYYMNNSLSVCSRGRYQAENAAVAATAAKLLFPDLSDSVIREGLLNAFWPGRMEEVGEGIIADGAHNEPSIRAFMDTVRMDGQKDNSRILVFAVAADKDYGKMAEELLKDHCFRTIILTGIPYERIEDPIKVKPVFEAYTKAPVWTEQSMERAYQMALEMRRPGELIYFAGSLYFIGSLEQYLKGDED